MQLVITQSLENVWNFSATKISPILFTRKFNISIEQFYATYAWNLKKIYFPITVAEPCKHLKAITMKSTTPSHIQVSSLILWCFQCDRNLNRTQFLFQDAVSISWKIKVSLLFALVSIWWAVVILLGIETHRAQLFEDQKTNESHQNK